MTTRFSAPVRPAGVPVAAVVLLLSFALVGVQSQATQSPGDAFTVLDVMIPARDGVRLHTKVFTPKNQTGPLPIILRRTPYGIEGADGSFVRYYKALADEGYVFVFQDIRGKFGSEGTFVMQRPARAPGDTTSLDEGTDTYDTIEWLLKNVPNHNGRIGMLGVSYDGWTTIMAAVEPHPALKAISPQASPADMWLGDDFHHNGAFRLSYAFEYATMMETGRDVQQFAFDRYDTFDWYLDLGPLANVNRNYLREKIPTWNDFVAHPDYDEFWKRQTMVPYLRDVKVPTLNVAGWWDQEDFYGPVRIYEALEQHDKAGMNYLVVGPWNHGGWTRTGEALGPITFGSDTAAYFRDQVQAPFFAYFLKDKGTRRLPRSADLRVRQQPVAALGTVAAEAGHPDSRPDVWRRRAPVPVHAHRRPASGSSSSARRARARVRRVRVRPGASRAVSAAPDSTDLLPWRLEVVHVAGRGSALRGRSARRPQLGEQCVDGRRHASPAR